MDFALVIIFSRIYLHTYYYIKDQKPLLLPTNNATTQNSQSAEVGEEETVITNEQPKIINHPSQVILLPLAAIIHMLGSVASTLLVNNAIG